MVVLKFGGSSVGNANRIKQVLQIVKEHPDDIGCIVFSAFSGITDLLLEMSELAEKGSNEYLQKFDEFTFRHSEIINSLFADSEIYSVKNHIEENHTILKNVLQGVFLVREASSRTMDYILSFGERNSCFIISEFFNQNEIKSVFTDTRNLIKTDKSFGSAIVDFDLSFRKIKKYQSKHNDSILIATGFISSAKGGLTTTLGRGGSDYTSAIFTTALNAQKLEIWTDVDGVLTADPRKVGKAFTIPKLSFMEALEMSHFGAKVIYPPTIQPILRENIPLFIRNTLNPSFSGTQISHTIDKNSPPVKGISSIPNVSLLTLQGGGLFGVPGIAARLFGALAKNSINIILITQGSSEHSISFAVTPADSELAKVSVEDEFQNELSKGLVDPIKIENELSVVAIIGENMRYRPGIAGKLFTALGRNGVNVVAIAQGSSELNISVVINKHNETKALNVLHEAFFLSGTSELNLFIVGVGLIGGTLIDQIKEQSESIREHQSLEINVVGITNTKTMIFKEHGIELEDWRKNFPTSEKADLKRFIDKMLDLNLPNSIFIDNTSSQEVTTFYKKILESSISISTPNKLAASSSYEDYLELKRLARRRGVLYRYETNVGAGLPVISTLNDLLSSGDEIKTIEGVFSGSLSYIFNSLTRNKRFSEIILEAKNLGLTEPDPRDDLSLMDFKRKLVILAREAGFNIEIQDIHADHLLPEELMNLQSVNEFLEHLPTIDDSFMDETIKAEAQGNKLRVIGRISNGAASISMASVGPENPFYSLQGSDNMIVYSTARYNDRPLVVKGPGAGAEVTAAGVFAEIIYIGNRIAKIYN